MASQLPHFIMQPALPATLSVVGEQLAFAVRRVYCVGRNYHDLSLIHISEPTRRYAI